MSTSGPMVALSRDGSRSIPWPDAVADVKAVEQAEPQKNGRRQWGSYDAEILSRILSKNLSRSRP